MHDPARRRGLAAFLKDIAEQVTVERSLFDGDELAQAILSEILLKLKDCGAIVGLENTMMEYRKKKSA